MANKENDKLKNKTADAVNTSKKKEPAKKYGVTIAERLNIRETPEADDIIKNIITTVPAGTKVEIVGEVDDFYKINVVDNAPVMPSATGAVPVYAKKEFISVK